MDLRELGIKMELRVKIARIQMAQQSSINSWKNQAEPRQSQTEPGTGQDKAKPSKAKQNQAEPRQTRQHQAGQGRTRQNPAEPGRTRQNQAEPGRTR